MQHPTIAIIGSGFGGIGMAIRLKQAGIETFTIYSRAEDVGGVWWENTYPGAACDVPSSLYSFSFEKHYDWERTHGMQREIVSYLRHCVDKYGLRPQMKFGTEIASVTFDEAAGLWRLRTTDGQDFTAQVVVSACGLFNKPAYPEIRGEADFPGPRFHSARWDHDVDLAGKRVAVIGTGCSAAQFVPEIVDKVASLTMFIRTPQYIVPKDDRVFTPAERGKYARFPLLRSYERIRTYVNFERRFGLQRSPEQQVQAQQGALAFLASQITDPEKRKRLTPTYRFGCKRLIQSNTYLAALNQPKVEIVNTKIERIVPEGVRTADGTTYPFDAVIYGTGFKPTEFLTPMQVVGLGGRPLTEAWRDGAEAYLGITVTGFPNFFLIYGPNTNTINSIVIMIEGQIGYIVDCIRRLTKRSARTMTVRAEVQKRFNDNLRALISRTAWGSGCHSYYVDANGRVTTQWPRPSRVYRWLTRSARPADYQFTP